MAEISLSWKGISTALESRPLLRERVEGFDVNQLVERIESEGEALWDPEHQIDNVPIQRAGHDKWGIDKVVFIFCDDYIQHVYTFPWYHQWQILLQKVFNALGVPKDRIIRCILARMPPNANIPVHHDTGAWVSQSHRIHVPLITDNLVDFMIGPTEEDMKRFEFSVGTIYELNNSCKHSVYNGSKIGRVHLILDYVEPEYQLNHISLQSGTKLHQTRRTLDLASATTARVPSFLILGVQKAGTTALYDYIAQHPLVVPAVRKETHYFDWRWNEALPDLSTAAGIKRHRQEYQRYFHGKKLMNYPSLCTGEATPSYIIGGRMMRQRVQLLAPEAQLIVILRNPVDRFISHYNMTADTKLKNRGHYELRGKTMSEVLAEELQMDFQKMTCDDFDQYLASRSQMKHGAHSYIGRGLYALQLEPWIKAFGREKLLILTMDDLKTCQATMGRVFKFLNLPPHEIEDTSAKNTRSYNSIEPELREKLVRFYEPYNEQLYTLLGCRFEWN